VRYILCISGELRTYLADLNEQAQNLAEEIILRGMIYEDNDGMRILEEFWYGNIEPTEYDTPSCKKHKKLLELICRNE